MVVRPYVYVYAKRRAMNNDSRLKLNFAFKLKEHIQQYLTFAYICGQQNKWNYVGFATGAKLLAYFIHRPTPYNTLPNIGG